MFRRIAGFVAALALGSPAGAELIVFDAQGGTATDQMVLYSSLDARLAAPLILAFQAANPGVAVRYEDLLTGEIHDRIVAETDAGLPTADLAFSSAMDLQVKLANDGYARPADVAESAGWPRWANWRDTAFALTFEPAVIVYHRPSFADHPPPTTRLDLIDHLRSGLSGGIGTYDIELSAVGFLFLARDQEHFGDIWSLVQAMGAAGATQFSTSQDILDRVTDGRLALGYNILGSYAADWALTHPEVGLILPGDYTVVVSRVALVPRGAARPDLGERFLSFMMSRAGQTVLAEQLRLPAISLEVSDENSAAAMQAALGDQLRPVAVSPGLLAYLDQAKRRQMIARWRAAMGPD